MKHKSHFLICMVLMLFFASVYLACPQAAAPKKGSAREKSSTSSSSETRGVQVTTKSNSAFGALYDKSYAVVIGINNYER